MALALGWPHSLGWHLVLCALVSASPDPEKPQTPGPVRGPPEGCLWALAPVRWGHLLSLLCNLLVLSLEADRAEVSRFAKNFLPILFNLYGQPVAAGDTPAPRRAVLETIKTYLTITEAQVSWQRRGRKAWVVGCQWVWERSGASLWGCHHLDLCPWKSRPGLEASKKGGQEGKKRGCGSLICCRSVFLSSPTPSFSSLPATSW